MIPPNSSSLKLHFLFSCSDNVPAVLLQEWEIEANLFSGDPLAGLVPNLYAENSTRYAFPYRSCSLYTYCLICLNGIIGSALSCDPVRS